MLKVVVIDTKKKFLVQILDGKKIVIELDWYGGKDNGHTHPFEYNGKMYAVFGPFHSFQGIEEYRLFELTEVARHGKQ